MKKHIAWLCGIAFLGLPAASFAAANFSGSWVRDASKSDPVPMTMYWLTRPNEAGIGGGRGGPGGGRGPQVPTVIQQDANSLEMTSPQGEVRKIVTDGKPHTERTATGVQKATITASMQGDTLTVGTTQPWGGMPGNISLDIKEVWSLSPDGKTLTITTTRTDAAVVKTYKEVYNKK